MDPRAVGWYLVLGLGVGLSLAVLFALSRPRGRWTRTLRERLYLGVPWGTLVAVVAVAAFYLFVQDGLSNPHNPVELPFRAYSYFYPLGMLTSGFAHSGLGHVTSNLLATLVFGSLAEYAWGHYPQDRGDRVRRLSTPFSRIAGWICAIAVVGISTSVFGLGPVIGFSGVLFAFVGFTLVQYPIATIVAALSTRIVTQLYNAIRTPELQQTATETFSQPWWAGIAIQGHALGLLIGAVAGIALLYLRDVRPKPEHVWLAALAFAVDRGLWAIYLPEGSGTFRLFRALGMAAVFVLAALLASGATATVRDLVPSPRIELTQRELAYGLVIASLLVIAFVAVPLNFYAVDDPKAGVEDVEHVEIEDYTVFYAEDIENQFVPLIEPPGTENRTGGGVGSSGLIVVSERRNIWWEEVSQRRLASQRAATVRLGGLTWNEDVRVNRTTWSVAGGNSTYHVRLGQASVEDRPVVFRSDPADADAVIDGRNVSIEPVDERFEIAVSRDNETIATTPVPADNATTTAGELTFVREDRSLFVERDETRVRIAQRAR